MADDATEMEVISQNGRSKTLGRLVNTLRRVSQYITIHQRGIEFRDTGTTLINIGVSRWDVTDDTYDWLRLLDYLSSPDMDPPVAR